MSKRKAERSRYTGSNRPSKNDDTLVDLVDVKESAAGMLQGNQLKILGIIGIGALIVGAFLAYKYLYQAPRNTAAMEQMYKAETQFKQDSFALALENPGGGFDGFLDIIDNYSGTKAANLSKYYAGISYLNLGRYQEAIEYLESFSADGQVTPITKHGALGDAYSELGELDNALSSYRKAASAGDNELLTPYYLKKVGMLLEKQGDSAAALEAYKKIENKYPSSTEGMDISKYIARIAS